MSHAILCDNCETMLRINDRGDDEYGERAAWITLGIADESFEVCSIVCAQVFLDDPKVSQRVADYLESIAGIARVIREDRAVAGPEETE